MQIKIILDFSAYDFSIIPYIFPSEAWQEITLLCIFVNKIQAADKYLCSLD